MLWGKKGFVFGLLNDYSLGWHFANPAGATAME
jgi:hypothetical protein